MTEPPSVTIAVVSWNTRTLLAACLRSMQPCSEDGEAEVWVVDNASSDGSADMVAADFPWVQLIRSEENLGYGRAVNLIARRTRGRWLAPANADVRLDPGALTTLVNAGEHDPEAGIVAPMLVLPDGSIQPSVQPYPTLSHALLLRLRAYRLDRRIGARLCLPGYRDPASEGHVDWAAGAFLLVRRAAFDAVGGFDEEQWLYAEDLDLAWRLSRTGWKTRYEPRATVHHEESAATRKVWGDALRAKWIGATYAWIARRRGFAAARSLAAFQIAMSVIEYAAYTLLAHASGSPRWPRRRASARRGIGLHRLGLRPREELVRYR